MVKSKWITIAATLLVMLAAMWLIDTEPDRFVPEPVSAIQIDTVAIKKSVLDSLLNTFRQRTNLTPRIDTSSIETYMVGISGIGDPAILLSKNYKDLQSATRKKNGFDVHIEGSGPPYLLTISLSSDKEFVVLPAGMMLALLEDQPSRHTFDQ